jgi:bleomycin hydrolase
VVPKALAPKELVKVYESGEKVVLPPWDPMVRSHFLSMNFLTLVRFVQGSLA